ncbi:MAG: hypothetical protein KTR21_12300 [Rhodobacteraceae bacterium]|nr:hypothetical protein [Paracoccaceae bacterium]
MLKKITMTTVIAIAALMSFMAISVEAQAGDYNGSHQHDQSKYYDDRHNDYHGYKNHKPVFKKIVKGHKVFNCKFWSKHRYTCEFSHYKKRHHSKHFSFKFDNKRGHHNHGKHY